MKERELKVKVKYKQTTKKNKCSDEIFNFFIFLNEFFSNIFARFNMILLRRIESRVITQSKVHVLWIIMIYYLNYRKFIFKILTKIIIFI